MYVNLKGLCGVYTYRIANGVCQICGFEAATYREYCDCVPVIGPNPDTGAPAPELPSYLSYEDNQVDYVIDEVMSFVPQQLLNQLHDSESRHAADGYYAMWQLNLTQCRVIDGALKSWFERAVLGWLAPNDSITMLMIPVGIPGERHGGENLLDVLHDEYTGTRVSSPKMFGTNEPEPIEPSPNEDWDDCDLPF